MTTPLSKTAWLQACHFHDLSEQEVLDQVAERVKNVKNALVLLDLDSTLYEVGPRTHQILREWLATPESKQYIQVHRELQKLEAAHIGYSIRDTFRAVGLRVEEIQVQQAWEVVKDFWAARFFTSSYLKYDAPYPGAVEFTRKLHELGAEIVYLTGRDEPAMGEGTRARLIQDGFPWTVPRTHLLLKPESALPDLEHKLNAGEYIRKHGTLVASFENEPANLSALYRAFPDAMHVFVDTVSSEHEAQVCQGLYRIQGFGVD
jgi:predicted secreted acid phosphatase